MDTQVLHQPSALSYESSLEFISISSTLALYKAKIVKCGTAPDNEVLYAPAEVAEYGIALLSELNAWKPGSGVKIQNLLDTGVSLSKLTGSEVADSIQGTVKLVLPAVAMGFYARQFTFRQVKTFLEAHQCSPQELFEYLKSIPDPSNAPKKHASIPPDRLVVVYFDKSDLLFTASGMPLLWIGSAISVSVSGSAEEITNWQNKAKMTKSVISEKLSNTPAGASVLFTFKVNETLRQALLSKAFISVREPEGLKPWKHLLHDWLTA